MLYKIQPYKKRLITRKITFKCYNTIKQLTVYKNCAILYSSNKGAIKNDCNKEIKNGNDGIKYNAS